MIQNQYEKYCLPQLKIYEQETFLVDHQGFRLTYEGLKEKIDARACELEKELAPGAIAILGKNTWNFYAAVLSCLKLNRPVFIFNSEWQKEQIQGNLEVLNISNLLRIESANQESVEICKRDMPLPNYQSGIYLATSGTTSQSKWVYQDLHAVFTNLRGLAQTVGLTAKDRIHSIIPLYTSNGMTITFFLPFSIGASIFLDQQFTPFSVGTYFKRGLENKVTVLSLVPSVVTILGKTSSSITTMAEHQHKIRFAICGTAPLREDDRNRFESKFSIPLYVNYGLTETLFVSSQNDTFRTPGSSGTLISNMEVIFRDGEIGIKGVSVMAGYLGQAGTADIFFSGDLGKYEQGELYITGRKKDMIIRGGYNINPNQIDSYLMQFQEIKECYTFGVVSEISGEELYSAIVLNNPKSDVMSRIRQIIQKDLPQYMVPKLLLVERIPRNSAGKPVKRELIQILDLETK